MANREERLFIFKIKHRTKVLQGKEYKERLNLASVTPADKDTSHLIASDTSEEGGCFHRNMSRCVKKIYVKYMSERKEKSNDF